MLLLTPMKALLVALLLCGAVVCGADTILQDEKFARLFNTARTLNALNSDWNERCHDSVDSDACQITKKRLDNLMETWLKLSEGFEPMGDPAECDTAIRGRLIDIHRKLFQWNLKWAGAQHSETEAKQAAVEMDNIEHYREHLEQEMDECSKAQHRDTSGKPAQLIPL